jgi:hypothetical protein
VVKPHEKRRLERLRRRLEDYIKMNLKEWEGDGTGSRQCPVAGFVIRDVEPENLLDSLIRNVILQTGNCMNYIGVSDPLNK